MYILCYTLYKRKQKICVYALDISKIVNVGEEGECVGIIVVTKKRINSG